MTDRANDQRNVRPENDRPTARLGAETVEPRILLSATWLIDAITSPPPDVSGAFGTLGADRLLGTGGNDSLFGYTGDDVFVGTAGDDTLWGGFGRDLVDYGGAATGMQIDLSEGTATGGSWTDDLIAIEGAVGSSHADVFAFATAADGDVFSVAGGGGDDVLALGQYDSSAVTFENGALVVDLGGGESFRIDYVDVEAIALRDTAATILTGDHADSAFVGDRLFVHDDHVFHLSFTGGGTLDWQYDAGSAEITVHGSAGSAGAGTLTIDDLGRSTATVGRIALGEDLQAITSSLDLGELDLQGHAVGKVTVDGGNGTIGTMVTGDVDTALQIDGAVTTLTINGDVSSTLTVTGRIASLTADDIDGTLLAGGDVDVLTAYRVTGDVTIEGDLGSATIKHFDPPATLRVDNPTGVVGITIDGVDKSADTGGEPFEYSAVDDVVKLVPKAAAGIDQVVEEGDTVALDATASTDPDGTGLTYLWTQVGGPSMTLSDPTDPNATFVAPEGLVNTAVKFQLRVDDGSSVSLDTVVITIQADNDGPAANAGANVLGAEGNVVALDGSGSSDPEGQALTYSWRQVGGPDVTIVNPTAARAGFVVPEALVNTIARFELTVSDGTTASVDTVDVLLLADNDAPVADAGADRAIDEGDLVLLDASGTKDPESQPLRYVWQQISGPPVALLAADEPIKQIAAPRADFGPPLLTADGRVQFVAPEGLSNTTATFRLVADDGENRSIDTVTITINADNDAPTVDAGQNRPVTAQEVVQLAATASDPENQPLTYQWVQLSGPTVELTGSDTATPTFRVPPGHTGELVVFGVRVSDGTNAAFDTVALRIENSPPVVAAGSAATAEPGESVGLMATAQDVDNDALTYRWTQISGPGVALMGAELPTAFFQAPDVSVPTQLHFQIEVDDGQTTTVRYVMIEIEPEPSATTGSQPGQTGGAPTAPTEPTEPTEPTGGTTAGSGSSSGGGSRGEPTGSSSAGATEPASDPTPLDPFADPFASEPEDADDAARDALRNATTPRATTDLAADDRDESTASDDGPTGSSAVDDAGDDGTTVLDDEAAVVVAAGGEVELAPFFLTSEDGTPTNITWTQLSGTPVESTDGAGGSRFRLPETFLAEELVFEVELLIDGEIRLQEVTVAVQPVDAIEKTGATKPQIAPRLTAAADIEVHESRGIGKVWASLIAFTSAGPTRLPRR